MSVTKPEQIGFRVSPEQKRELHARADAAGLTLTDFVLGAALGTLPAQTSSTEDRLEQVERQLAGLDGRLARIEELAGG